MRIKCCTFVVLYIYPIDIYCKSIIVNKLLFVSVLIDSVKTKINNVTNQTFLIADNDISQKSYSCSESLGFILYIGLNLLFYCIWLRMFETVDKFKHIRLGSMYPKSNNVSQ